MFENHEFRRVICGNCGHIADVPVYCGDRFCSVCSGPRRRRLIERLGAIIRAVPPKRSFKWRFITLTIPTSDDPGAALDILYKSFRRLRNRDFWKRNVEGGFSGAEITRSNGRWHVHIHVVAFARYIPQHDLVKLWKSVSPGKIVDIRLLPETTAVHYITKYITKQNLPEEYRASASAALSNRRLYTSFGVCHNIRVFTKKADFPCPCCRQSDWILLRDLSNPAIPEMLFSSPG